MQYTEIEPMMNTKKLKSFSELDRPKVLVNPVIDIKPYHDQDFYDKCLEFRTKFKTLNEMILEVENHVKIVNSRCDRMNNLIELMELTDNNELRSDLEGFVQRFREYYDIENLEKRIGDLHTERNSMMNVIKLFCSTQEPNMCPLCLENETSMFSIPCGHTACSDCVNKNTAFTCPFCRAKIDRVGKIFLV